MRASWRASLLSRPISIRIQRRIADSEDVHICPNLFVAKFEYAPLNEARLQHSVPSMRFSASSGHHLEEGNGNSIAGYGMGRTVTAGFRPYSVQATSTTQYLVWVVKRLRLSRRWRGGICRQVAKVGLGDVVSLCESATHPAPGRLPTALVWAQACPKRPEVLALGPSKS